MIPNQKDDSTDDEEQAQPARVAVQDPNTDAIASLPIGNPNAVPATLPSGPGSVHRGLLGNISDQLAALADRGISNATAGVPSAIFDPSKLSEAEHRALRFNYLAHVGQGLSQGSPAAGMDSFKNAVVQSGAQKLQLAQQNQIQQGTSAIMNGPGTRAEQYRALAALHAQVGNTAGAKSYSDIADKMDEGNQPVGEPYSSIDPNTKQPFQSVLLKNGTTKRLPASAPYEKPLTLTEQANGQKDSLIAAAMAAKGVTDQAGLDSVRGTLPPAIAAMLPPMYSPQAIASLQSRAITPDQQALLDKKDPGAATAAQTEDYRQILEKARVPVSAQASGATVQNYLNASPLISDAEKQRGNSYALTHVIAPATAYNIVVRGETFGANRDIPVLDRNDQTQTFASQAMINADLANAAAHPGTKPRYEPLAQGLNTLAKDAQFTEMEQALKANRAALIDAGDKLSSPAQAMISYVTQHPEGGLGTLMNGQALYLLSPKEQQLVITRGRLAENILSLRNVAGMGQGSESMRAAITAMVPTGVAPLKFSLGQLDAIGSTVSSLKTGLGNARNTPAVLPGVGSDMIPAQVPGQAPGQIHRAQRGAFLQKFPNAVVGQ
jgi:hypothetical protein